MTGKEIQDKIKRYSPVSGTYFLKLVLVILNRIHKCCYKMLHIN